MFAILKFLRTVHQYFVTEVSVRSVGLISKG